MYFLDIQLTRSKDVHSVLWDLAAPPSSSLSVLLPMRQIDAKVSFLIRRGNVLNIHVTNFDEHQSCWIVYCCLLRWKHLIGRVNNQSLLNFTRIWMPHSTSRLKREEKSQTELDRLWLFHCSILSANSAPRALARCPSCQLRLMLIHGYLTKMSFGVWPSESFCPPINSVVQLRFCRCRGSLCPHKTAI